MKRIDVIFAALAAVALCGASPASAAAEDEWQFTIIPYIWLPSVSSDLDVPGVPIDLEADTDSSDIFDKLDFAMLLAGEVRKGRVGLYYDMQYLKLSDDNTSSGLVPRDYEADVTFADGTLALEYRLIDSPKFSLDALGGARVFYADIGAKVGPGAVLPGFSGGGHETWVDPIVGANAVVHLGEKWTLEAYGDIGGFGVSSDMTYQLLGTVGYRFNKTFSIHAGYCAFMVDFERDDFKFDALMHGPIVGFAFQF